MAVTITTSPSLLNASGHPIIFEATSSRDLAGLSVAVTSVSSGTGGYARYAVASHIWVVGDVVTGSAFAGINVAYNVRQTVTVVSGAYFETDLLFVATATGAGTITRTNDNFQLKCETFVFDETKKTISNSGNNGGYQSVTTSTNHELSVGDLVYIYDTTGDVFEGINKVRSITSSTVFVLELAFAGSSLVGYMILGRLVGTNRQQKVIISAVEAYRFTASGHLQSVLAPYLVDSQPANIDTTDNDAIKLFGVRFTEEFDDVDGLTTEGESIISSMRTAARAALQRTEGININTAFVISGSSTGFLTNAPLIKKIRIGEEEQLSFLYAGSTQLRAGIIKYNLSGVVQPDVFTTLKTINQYRGVLPINSNHFDNTVSKFEVILVDSVPNQYSEIRTFVVDYNNYSNPVRVYFENNLGGFDAYTFTCGYSETNNVEKTAYRKSLPLVYSLKDRGLTNISSIQNRTYEVYSEYLTKEEGRWLSRLLGSTNVYIKNVGDSDFTPIVVLNNSDVLYDSNGLVQIKLSYIMATNDSTLNN